MQAFEDKNYKVYKYENGWIRVPFHEVLNLKARELANNSYLIKQIEPEIFYCGNDEVYKLIPQDKEINWINFFFVELFGKSFENGLNFQDYNDKTIYQSIIVDKCVSFFKGKIVYGQETRSRNLYRFNRSPHAIKGPRKTVTRKTWV